MLTVGTQRGGTRAYISLAEAPGRFGEVGELDVLDGRRRAAALEPVSALVVEVVDREQRKQAEQREHVAHDDGDLRRVVPRGLPAEERLRADEVAHAVADQQEGLRGDLLGVAQRVGAEQRQEADHADRRQRVQVQPGELRAGVGGEREHARAGDDDDGDERRDGDAVREPPDKQRERDEADGLDGAAGHAHQQALLVAVLQRVRQQDRHERAEPAVGDVGRERVQEPEPRARVRERLAELVPLPLGAAVALPAVLDALEHEHALARAQEPRVRRVVRDVHEQQRAQHDGDGAGHDEQHLPGRDRVRGGVHVAAVRDGAAQDRAEPVVRVVHHRAQKGLLLAVPLGGQQHEAGGHGGLEGAEQHAAHEEARVVRARGVARQHHAPQNDARGGRLDQREPLQTARQREHGREKREVERGRGPRVLLAGHVQVGAQAHDGGEGRGALVHVLDAVDEGDEREDHEVGLAAQRGVLGVGGVVDGRQAAGVLQRDVGVVLVDDDVLAEGALGGHSLRLLAGGKYIGAGGKGLPGWLR
ncbi:hypothetical protein KL951_005392 [Ogataea haglerorum]|nr:hypothetical protein KL951_005392 [Ogataea haglerorum]